MPIPFALRRHFLCMNRISMAASIRPQSFDAYIAGYQLIVTTPTDVHSWSSRGNQIAFHSSTGGILAAKRIFNHGNFIAVSDRQGILLHDLDRRTTNSYKLTGTKGRVRTTHYDKSTRRLFFTTKLQDAVQCFSLEHGRLLRSAAIHPSPPLTFAFSASMDVVLSASVKPPVTFLTCMGGKVPPLVVRTGRSKSPVAAAAFQGDSGTEFALLFFDGTMVLYDVYNFRGLRSHSMIATEFKVRELGYIIGVHSVSPSCAANTQDDSRSGSSATSDPKNTGRLCIAFVPGRERVIISAGPDGKCSVITAKAAAAHGHLTFSNKSWSVGAAATSLAIAMSRLYPRILPGKPPHGTAQTDVTPLISVGRVDGIISLFNMDGQRLAEASVSKLCPIIGVEWIASNLEGNEASSPDQVQEAADPKSNPVAESNEQTCSPTRSVYYTPSKSFPRRRQTHLEPVGDSPRKTRLRKPVIPVRKRSRLIWPSSSIRYRPSLVLEGHRQGDSNEPTPVPAMEQAHKTRKPVPRMSEVDRARNDQGNADFTASSNDSIFYLKLDESGNAGRKLESITPKTPPDTRQVRKTSFAPSRARGLFLSRDTDNTVIAWKDRKAPSGPTSQQQVPQTPVRVHHRQPSEQKVSNLQNSRLPESTIPASNGLSRPRTSSSPHLKYYPPLIPRNFTTPGETEPSNSEARSVSALSAADGSSTSFPYVNDPNLRISDDPGTTEPPPPPPPPGTPRTSTPVPLSPVRADIGSVRALLLAEMALLRDELSTQFRQQREWFESLLTDQRGRRLLMLEQRNRILKLELFRMRDKNNENAKGKAGKVNAAP